MENSVFENFSLREQNEYLLKEIESLKERNQKLEERFEENK